MGDLDQIPTQKELQEAEIKKQFISPSPVKGILNNVSKGVLGVGLLGIAASSISLLNPQFNFNLICLPSSAFVILGLIGIGLTYNAPFHYKNLREDVIGPQGNDMYNLPNDKIL